MYENNVENMHTDVTCKVLGPKKNRSERNKYWQDFRQLHQPDADTLTRGLSYKKYLEYVRDQYARDMTSDTLPVAAANCNGVSTWFSFPWFIAPFGFAPASNNSCWWLRDKILSCFQRRNKKVGDRLESPAQRKLGPGCSKTRLT